MPRIVVQANIGKSVEQKAELIRRITAAMVDVFGSVPDTVSVLIQESDPNNVGRAGITDAERQRQAKAAS